MTGQGVGAVWFVLPLMVGAMDAGVLAGTLCEDLDRDGFSSTPGCGVLDCNDADPHVFPGAPELCNGRDDDCDGETDEGCAGTCTSPEKRFGDRRIDGSGGADQRMPSMVRIRNGYAVSWNQRVSDPGYECGGEIRVARIDEDGSLRFGPTRVGAPGSPGRARWESYLDWSGEEFVVGVGDVPIADCTTPGPERAYFQRLDEELRPVGETIDVSCLSGATGAGGVAWTGAHWILFWGAGDNVPETQKGYYAMRLSSNGEVMDPCGVQLRSGPPNTFTVGKSDAGVLLAWSGGPPEGPQFNSEIYVQRFTFDLVPIDSEPRRITFNDGRSAEVTVTWADGEWALAWAQDVVFGYHEIAFARLDSDLEIVTPPGIVQVTTGADQPGGFNKGFPKVVWTGQEYGIVYHLTTNVVAGTGDLWFARLSADGTHLRPDASMTPDTRRDALFHAPVWNGEDYAVAWQDNDASGQVIVKFGKMGCRCGDLDGDGFTSCAGNDCDDTRNDVNPLRPELCGEGADNDCNGLTDCNDEAVCPALGPPPPDVTGLTAGGDKSGWTWAPAPGADRYDVVRGWLRDLAYEGDARAASCLHSDLFGTGFSDGEVPVRGDGYFYLVRAQSGSASSCVTGSWGSADDAVIRSCP